MTTAKLLPKIDKVAIIGAGPSGCATAKALLSEGLRPTLFEQQSTFGGVWNYTPETKSRLHKVPLEDPNGEDDPVEGLPDSSGEGTGRRVIMNPVYASLETNIPKTLMIFNGVEFDEGLPLFPEHEDVRDYVRKYSGELAEITKFERKVVSVGKIGENRKWKVESRHTLEGGSIEQEDFDAVVVASGHYSIPYIPPIEGMEEFEQQYPGVIQHSKYFRTAERYKGKKVIVVGNSASGVDIAAQIAEVAQTPVYQSVRRQDSKFATLAGKKIVTMTTISSFDLNDHTAVFSDGQQVSGIDTVLFCTGYLHSLPFLNFPSLNLPASENPVTNGFRLHRMYQHIFYIPDPTLSIVGLPTKVIPFPFSETQAAVVSGVYSGRLSLPSESEMRQWEQDRLKVKGVNNRHFHFFGYPEDAAYMDLMNKWNDEIDPEKDRRGSWRPTRWGERGRRIREVVHLMKGRDIEEKSRGRLVKTMKELGFDIPE